MSRKESVLTREEKESFEIKNFIFHIILESNETPIYLDEVVLNEDQINFFKHRFSDVSEGVQHIFKDKTTSDFYKNCSLLIQNPEENFLQVSRLLTASFKGHHKKSTNDGVFITSLVKVKNEIPLIFLLKLDNKKVFQYAVERNKALLNEIYRTFVEDRKAIQKSALVDISDNYAWDVLATDRTTTGDKALRDYFAGFLGVVEKETPSTLTRTATSIIRKWAISEKDNLDPEQDISSYKKRGIDYLNGTAVFDIYGYIDAVIEDKDESRKEKLKESFKQYCDVVGLSGQSFIPSKGSIDRAIRKNVRETAEGVKIEWEGDPSDSRIEIPSSPNTEDGLYHIRIKTSKIKILDK